MQLIALDDLNRGLDPLHHAVGKRLAGVAAIGQDAFNLRQIRLRAVYGPQCAVPVGDIGVVTAMAWGKPCVSTAM